MRDLGIAIEVLAATPDWMAEPLEARDQLRKLSGLALEPASLYHATRNNEAAHQALRHALDAMKAAGLALDPVSGQDVVPGGIP